MQHYIKIISNQMKADVFNLCVRVNKICVRLCGMWEIDKIKCVGNFFFDLNKANEYFI